MFKFSLVYLCSTNFVQFKLKLANVKQLHKHTHTLSLPSVNRIYIYIDVNTSVHTHTDTFADICIHLKRLCIGSRKARTHAVFPFVYYIYALYVFQTSIFNPLIQTYSHIDTGAHTYSCLHKLVTFSAPRLRTTYRAKNI